MKKDYEAETSAMTLYKNELDSGKVVGAFSSPASLASSTFICSKDRLEREREKEMQVGRGAR